MFKCREKKKRKVTLQPLFSTSKKKQKTKFFRFIHWMEYYHHHSSYRSSCFSFFPRITLYCVGNMHRLKRFNISRFLFLVGFLIKLMSSSSSSCDVSLMNLVYHKFFFINMVLIFFRYRFFWLLVMMMMIMMMVCVCHSFNKLV